MEKHLGKIIMLFILILVAGLVALYIASPLFDTGWHEAKGIELYKDGTLKEIH